MITVYSKDQCPQCEQAKKLLSMYGIEFNEININEDQAARDFVVSEGHRSVPQIYFNKTVPFVENGLSGLIALGKDGIEKRIEGLNV